MQRVLDDVVAEVVGLAIDRTALGAAAGHPHGETARVVVATVVLLGETALAVDRATELAAPDDEGVLEHAALLEVLDERRAGLIDVATLAGHAAGHVGMMVPVVVVDLGEADAALGQATRHEHAVGEAAGLPRLLAIQLEGVLGLAGQIGQFRHACLHAEGHFVLLDARVRLGIAHLAVVDLVERLHAVEHAPAHAVVDTGRVVDEEDGVALAAERHPRVLARQVAARPQARGDGLLLLAIGRRGDEHDKTRQVLIHRAEAIRGPGTEAGPAGHLVAGLHGADRRLVVDRFGVQRAHPADVIGHLAEVRQQVGIHPHAALAALLEAELRRRDREPRLAAGHRRQPLALADAVGQILVVPLLHLRLVIEQVHLRGTADHVQVDDALRLRRKVGGHLAGSGERAPAEGLAQQRTQCGVTEDIATPRKKPAPGFKGLPIVQGVHGEKFKVEGFKFYLFSTSSRFMTWLQTIVHAASSGAGSLGSGLVSPTAIRAAASAGWVP